jgi:hypothetical protein
MGSRDNAVGIATGYGLDVRGVGVRVPVGSRIWWRWEEKLGGLRYKNGLCGRQYTVDDHVTFTNPKVQSCWQADSR